MAMEAIVHITPRLAWEDAQTLGAYRAASLDDEGFIHCSRPDQALRSANLYFPGRSDLVLLWIDPARLQSTLRFDPVGSDEFPHIYGPLNLEAVFAVLDFPPEADGAFVRLPMP